MPALPPIAPNNSLLEYFMLCLIHSCLPPPSSPAICPPQCLGFGGVSLGGKGFIKIGMSFFTNTYLFTLPDPKQTPFYNTVLNPDITSFFCCLLLLSPSLGCKPRKDRKFILFSLFLLGAHLLINVVILQACYHLPSQCSHNTS